MEVAQLFVGLGVKGSEKTVGAITGMRKGLKETASVGLETKAAIIGVMYALERLFAASGRAGTNLQNFTNTTGVSAQVLQRYSWAADQVGIASGTVEKSLIAMQDAMTNVQNNEDAPAGLARLSQVLKESFTMDDVADWAKNPQKALDVLSRYTRAEQDFGMKRKTLNTFGAGGLQAAFQVDAFSPDKLAKAPTYSDKEIQALASADRAWRNLGTSIEMAIGHFNAKHGGQIVDEIGRIVKSVASLAEEFMKFSEAVNLFGKIDKIVKGWEAVFKGLTDAAKAFNALTEKDPEKAREKFLATGTGEMFSAVVGEAPRKAKPYTAEEIAERKRQEQEPLFQLFMSLGQRMFGVAPGTKDMRGKIDEPGFWDQKVHVGADDGKIGLHAVPNMPAGSGPTPAAGDTNVTVNLQVANPGNDPQKIVDMHKRGATEAYRQSSALKR